MWQPIKTKENIFRKYYQDGYVKDSKIKETIDCSQNRLIIYHFIKNVCWYSNLFVYII